MLVIGAGVIGLAIAWRCRQRGLSVTVVDPAPGSGASTTAAGMLAPVTELNYGELDLLRLGIESARRYPAFAAELEAATGLDVGYRRVRHRGRRLGRRRPRRLARPACAADVARAVGRADHRPRAAALEPALAPGLPGGLFAADDHQVDNRRLHAALLPSPVRS